MAQDTIFLYFWTKKLNLKQVRIDKFLWHSRIYKSRSKAIEACRKKQIKINKNPVKPSFEVHQNMIIVVNKKQIVYEYKILDIPSKRISPKIVYLYLEQITSQIQMEKNEILISNKKLLNQT